MCVGSEGSGVGGHVVMWGVFRQRQKSIKPQRKAAWGRKSEWPLNHPQPKLFSVLSAVGSMHQESDSTATSGHARTDPQPSQNLICVESAIIIVYEVK